MKKKLFVISDPHAFYRETINALKDAGYDEENDNHLLIVCGDIFSRGSESVAMYEWLKKLTDDNKAIVIKGNHCQMTQDYLDGTSISPFNWMYNGERETFDDFTHRTASFESWCMFEGGNCEMNTESFQKWLSVSRKEINDEYPDLLPWLKSLPYYYETQNYIFTHGMIDGQCDDWHNPIMSWYECTWAKPEDFKNEIVNTDKTVVVGHINCGLLRGLYGFDDKDNSIFTRPDGKIIGLDTCTVLTHRVNVLVIEDELL